MSGAEPVQTPFVDDGSKIPAGEARLVVRHTAAAPAVDVLAGGEVVVAGPTDPNQKALVVPAGTQICRRPASRLRGGQH